MGAQRHMLLLLLWLCSVFAIITAATIAKPIGIHPTLTASKKKKNINAIAEVKGTQGSSSNFLKDFSAEFISIVKSSKNHLMAGAAARGISIFLLYPLDTIKTRLQMSAAKRANLAPLALSTLYRGVIGSLIGQIPYGMLTFGSYEVYKSKFIAACPETPKEYLYIVSAILGDITGSFWLCPSEVIKQQMQGGVHTNIVSAIKSTFKATGLKGFYRGYYGQIMRDVPFRAIQLPSYEVVKRIYMRKFTLDVDGETPLREMKPLDNMIVGAIAGSFSAALTTPLDVIKTRLMTDTTAVISMSTVAQAGQKLFENEGFKGLFSGLGPRVIYVGPSCGVFFVVYESAKSFLATRQQRGICAAGSGSCSSKKKEACSRVHNGVRVCK